VLEIWRQFNLQHSPTLRVAKIKSLSSLSYMGINELSNEIIGAAIEVHKTLGSGLLESTYEECLCHELHLRRLSYQRQKELPISYKGLHLANSYRLDLVVNNQIIIELKSCESIYFADS
jgi:GxxExxY protein